MRVLHTTFILLVLCSAICSAQETLKNKILENPEFAFVKEKALSIIKSGFNAGDGYSEVWIRDYNTFIELSAEVFDYNVLKENLLVFFRLQGEDGNIVDGFIPKSKAVKSEGGYRYIYTELEPNYCGHKNTVETYHETSLIQAVYKLVKATGDATILTEKVGEMSWGWQLLVRGLRFGREARRLRW